MTYANASKEQIKQFNESGFIVIKKAINPTHKGALTPWHQDEAYWGRNYPDAGITCWMPFHKVTVENGCMEFIQAGHLTARHPIDPMGIFLENGEKH